VECELEFEARTYDVDFAGVVSNIVYHRWLEDLRLAVFAQAMPVAEMVRAGLVPTIAQTLIDFRAPLRLGERVRGRQAITSAGNSSFVLESELRRIPDGQLVVVARHTAVLVASATGRPASVPESLRQLVTTPSFEVRLRGVDDPKPSPG
jgi:acyl-CoA thioester hydrolase